MGNSLDKKLFAQKKKVVREEWERKKKHRIVLFVGVNGCGKTQIIETFLKGYGNMRMSEDDFKSRRVDIQYDFKSFLVNEYAFGSHDGGSKYKFIQESLENIKVRENKKLIYISEENSNAELLTAAYLRDEDMMHEVPLEIYTVIVLYVTDCDSTIDSYLMNLRDQNQVYEFWELEMKGKEHWHKLYPYCHAVVFVFDLSCYDECDAQERNRMSVQLEALQSVISCKTDESECKWIVMCTKKDLYDEKIAKDIPLDKCEEFKRIRDNDADEIASFVEKRCKELIDVGNNGWKFEWTYTVSGKDSESAKQFWSIRNHIR